MGELPGPRRFLVKARDCFQATTVFNQNQHPGIVMTFEVEGLKA